LSDPINHKTTRDKSRRDWFSWPGFKQACITDSKSFRRLLFCILILYLCGFSGEPISTIDDQVMLTSAMSLVKTGKLIVPERFAEKTATRKNMFARTAISGDVYSKYPPGYPLILAAFLPPSKIADTQFGSIKADRKRNWIANEDEGSFFRPQQYWSTGMLPRQPSSMAAEKLGRLEQRSLKCRQQYQGDLNGN